MFEHVIRDISPAPPSLGMPWLQESADTLVELSLPRRFRFLSLPEAKARELRAILERMEDADRIACDTSDTCQSATISFVYIGESLPLDMSGYAAPAFPAIAIVGRGLPDIDRLFEYGFADYITYPFCSPEIQRRLSGAPTSIHDVTFSAGLGSDPMVRAACEALETNIAATVTVDELAAILGTNRNTLNRAFNQVFGVGPITWLRQRRCEIAAQLLRDSSESVLNIALTVGYGDPNNFSTAFRRHYNQGPLEFRKKCQAQRI
ncbi:AraC family transcriptional regulator [Rhizobium sp. P44RR-XXIV]|uniref:helix-turn-helix domain-containing protein n=1 Tax=Rhizobium sp. P44RR-XXIV TaxID=1921145 RepID=UPI0009D2DE70|nr:AraC family transcriptional regulator [Rhizobium sp. P44RR-XXIV]